MSYSPQSPSKVAPASSGVGRAPVQDEGTSPIRKSERAHWAPWKLGRRVDVDQGDQDRGRFNSGEGFVFVGERCEGPPPGFDCDSDERLGGSSGLRHEMESNRSDHRTRKECSPLKLYGRRCAKAAVGCAALALSVAAIRLLAEDRRAFGMVHRKPPQGGGKGKDAVPIPWLPRDDQDEDPEEEAAPPQEKTRRSKEGRTEDHEERVQLQVAECKQRNYEAAACRSMLQEASHPDAYYYNFSEEDGRTAPQDRQYRRLLRGVGLDQDGDEEGYNFQYRGHVQGTDGDYRDDEESSRGFRMVQALLEGFEREFERERAGMRQPS